MYVLPLWVGSLGRLRSVCSKAIIKVLARADSHLKFPLGQDLLPRSHGGQPNSVPCGCRTGRLRSQLIVGQQLPSVLATWASPNMAPGWIKARKGESPCKTEIPVPCDTFTKGMSHHPCCILLVEGKSHVPLTLEGRGSHRGTDTRKGDPQGHQSACKGPSPGPDTYRHSFSVDRRDGEKRDMTRKQKAEKKSFGSFFIWASCF